MKCCEKLDQSHEDKSVHSTGSRGGVGRGARLRPGYTGGSDASECAPVCSFTMREWCNSSFHLGACERTKVRRNGRSGAQAERRSD